MLISWSSVHSWQSLLNDLHIPKHSAERGHQGNFLDYHLHVISKSPIAILLALTVARHPIDSKSYLALLDLELHTRLRQL